MIFGVYVGNKRHRGRRVFTTDSLRRAVEAAEVQDVWRWVWIRVVA